MTLFTRVATTLAALALSATVALSQEYKLGTLDISHTWAKATITGQPVGSGFLTITNNGTEPDRLVKITSDVSAKVQIHEMKIENGIMKMGELPDGIEIAPGATVELKPGTLHIMFMGIKSPFKEGEAFKATLSFEKAGTVEAEFKIEAGRPGDKAQKHHSQ
ncbi:copper chaperone PCu(A)C [Rhizobium sp.]